MKAKVDAPIERLFWFQDKLRLGETEQEKLDQYRGVLSKNKERFAEDFYEYFCQIPETRLILEHETRTGHLKKAWRQWFENLFTEGFNEKYLTYLWRSGLRHVEVNLDQRFINLGYSIVRQFCNEIVREGIPVVDQDSVMSAIDKMVDLCLLIETYAYIAATSQCDMEIVKGISHQVRNPLTVIGGNIIRLQRQVDPSSPISKTYETILGENKRLEAMVTDAGAYSEMFEREPAFSETPLESLISGALERLKSRYWVENIKIDMDLNSLEAVDQKAPYIRISSTQMSSTPSFIEIEIFNNGTPPSKQDMDNLFVPFYSSKPLGTGFGLPIAGLAARKSLGDLTLEPVPKQGTKCVIKLPIPLKNVPKTTNR
jgi:signal transduction histidine kinase